MYEYWFSSPIKNDILYSIDNQQILNYCVNLKSTDCGRELSNVGGWQSTDINFQNKEIDNLLSLVWSHAERFKIDLNMKPSIKIVIKNMWVNVNGYGHFNKPHIHDNSLFSGVYYVKCNKDSGNICFENPAINHRYHMNTGMFLSNTLIGSSECKYAPTERQLIMFPSWLLHYVEPNQSNEDRISIAFNIGIE
jgi:uncharacterized protein (TIGR02466 family)